jgi:predicted short-subunit dehydrogenase-like oxidoreductase (DUF2520 family)
MNPRDPLDVAVLGAGRVGTAVAVLLAGAGHRIRAASGGDRSRARIQAHLPSVPFLPPAEAARGSTVIVLGVPDDRIDDVCASLRWRSGQAVIHLSGSVSLAALARARDDGAAVLSVHPLQTVPDVEAGIARLPGSAFAVTAEDEPGYALGERLAADAGGRPFRLPDERKPLYHAAAVFCSNYLAVVEATAARLLTEAGVPDPRAAMAPLARATLENVLVDGPVALTGPAARGDAGTVGRNLEAVAAAAPDLVPAYVALADAALDIAEAGGRLDHAARARVEEVLARWR